MSEANGSYSRVSVSVGSDWRVRCLPMAGHAPVLDIDAGEIEVSVSLAEQGDPGLGGRVRRRARSRGRAVRCRGRAPVRRPAGRHPGSGRRRPGGLIPKR